MQRNHKNLQRFFFFFSCNTRQMTQKGTSSFALEMSWHMGQNGRSEKNKTQNCAAASADFHLSTTVFVRAKLPHHPNCTCPPKTERNRGSKPKKKEGLTAFSTAGWLFRNNLAGVCWLCLRSADSCGASLPFSFFGINVFPLPWLFFAVLNSFSAGYSSVWHSFHLRDRAILSPLLPGAWCAN